MQHILLLESRLTTLSFSLFLHLDPNNEPIYAGGEEKKTSFYLPYFYQGKTEAKLDRSGLISSTCPGRAWVAIRDHMRGPRVVIDVAAESYDTL